MESISIIYFIDYTIDSDNSCDCSLMNSIDYGEYLYYLIVFPDKIYKCKENSSKQ